jgi:hypothetical protein
MGVRPREATSAGAVVDAVSATLVSSTPPEGAGSVRRARRDAVLPTWFVAGLAAVIVACATGGLVGLGLLLADRYHPAVVLLSACVTGGATAFIAARLLGQRSALQWPALVAVGLALGFFGLAAGFHSEHLLTDRDPGVYVNAGRSIARTHQLHPLVRTGAFSDRALYSMQAAGFNESKHGRLKPNFFPLLPVVLALGWSIGGDRGLLVVPAVLATLGVLSCYALASRVIGSRAALFAPLFLVIAPMQLWFARDAYSELPVQVLVLGGLWLYLEARRRHAAVIAAVAGALIGTSAFARIDALLIMFGVVVFTGVEWIRCDRDTNARRARAVVGSFGASFGATLTCALVTTSNVAHDYVRELHGEFRRGLLGLFATLAVFVALLVVHRLRPHLWQRVARNRTLFASCAVAAGVFFAWCYWWRPKPERALPVASFPRPRSVGRTINDWHWSHVLHWFSSYWGFGALVAVVVGFGLLALRARGGNRAAVAICLVVVPVAVLYVVRPSIAPDQPWAMRRFLPVVIPGAAIAIAVVIATLWGFRQRLRAGPVRLAATTCIAALVVVFIAPSGTAARPFFDARMQHGALQAIHTICRTVGRDAAVVEYGFHYADLELPQTIRGFCGVPTAKPRHLGAVDLPQLAGKWQLLGRRLYVVTAEPDRIATAAPGAQKLAHVTIDDAYELQRTKDERPTRASPRKRDIWVFAVPARGDGA